MSAPRLTLDLRRIEENARTLVQRLAPRGIRVVGVTKAALGAPAVARAMLAGGVTGLGDARLENLARLHAAGVEAPRTLIRAPMLSQVDAVVAVADRSLNSEAAVLDALAAAAVEQGRTHEVVLMVELGDLREGVAAGDLVGLARHVRARTGLVLAGIGTNLACQSGVVPDQAKMDELSALAADVEAACDVSLAVVSGGNSANLDWALRTEHVGRVDELRLGEAILLGTDPLHRRPIDGLHPDAVALVAEVIEVQVKPAQPWGHLAQSAFGPPGPRRDGPAVRQAIVAVGRQDIDPDDTTPPEGTTILGASSDHLVLDVGDTGVVVGDHLSFALGYSALVRAMTSPFVSKVMGR